ncbi:MAG: response regulator, partial [Candidatus Eremiobacterota bacterium]
MLISATCSPCSPIKKGDYMLKLLLIDDDKELLELLEEYLTNNDMEVYKASCGEKALEMLKEDRFDIAILDVMMPKMNGLEVLKRINNEYNYLPVIMLTAKGEEVDRILGLEMGADDYIPKPFNPRELLARIKAVIRRKEKVDITNGTDEISADTVKLDLKKRQAIVRGELMELTSLEFDILNIFVQNRGIVLSREKIMDLSRGQTFTAFDRSIDANISRLRQKIEKDPKKPELIKTI